MHMGDDVTMSGFGISIISSWVKMLDTDINKILLHTHKHESRIQNETYLFNQGREIFALYRLRADSVAFCTNIEVSVPQTSSLTKVLVLSLNQTLLAIISAVPVSVVWSCFNDFRSISISASMLLMSSMGNLRTICGWVSVLGTPRHCILQCAIMGPFA